MATSASCQVYFFAGGHKSDVRNDVLKNESPIYASHVGIGINILPGAKIEKWFINAEISAIKKGYNQTIGVEKFEFRFTYVAFQPTVAYTPYQWLRISAGVNLAALFDTNVTKGFNTYNNGDFSLVGGLNFLENRRLGIYTQLVYGLTPMLDYPRIDALGNFNGNIRDLRNTCVLVGLRFNINNEKIRL